MVQAQIQELAVVIQTLQEENRGLVIIIEVVAEQSTSRYGFRLGDAVEEVLKRTFDGNNFQEWAFRAETNL